MVILTTFTSITRSNNHATTTELSSDDGKSIEPNYREGFEIGKMQGIEDYSSGKEHEDCCPPGKDVILLSIGYETYS